MLDPEFKPTVHLEFAIKITPIESVTLSSSKLYVKSNGKYYEKGVIDFWFGNLFSLDKDFSKNTTLKNII